MYLRVLRRNDRECCENIEEKFGARKINLRTSATSLLRGWFAIQIRREYSHLITNYQQIEMRCKYKFSFLNERAEIYATGIYKYLAGESASELAMSEEGSRRCNVTNWKEASRQSPKCMLNRLLARPLAQVRADRQARFLSSNNS